MKDNTFLHGLRKFSLINPVDFLKNKSKPPASYSSQYTCLTVVISFVSFNSKKNKDSLNSHWCWRLQILKQLRFVSFSPLHQIFLFCSVQGLLWFTLLIFQISGLWLSNTYDCRAPKSLSPASLSKKMGRAQSCVCELEPQKQWAPRHRVSAASVFLKNRRSLLGSTSHPSQTNEAPPPPPPPRASKWDWSAFFETRHRTLGFWIWRKVPLAMETQCTSPPPLPLPPSAFHPPLEWCGGDKKNKKKGDPVEFFNFINIHSFIVNPGSKFSTVLLDGCSPLSLRAASEIEF